LMTNERAFYFDLADGSYSICGYGLVHGQPYGWGEKPILYPGFQSIVNGH
jgi:hypothetical protein